MSEQPLLELRGVFKRFGAVTALGGVDFHTDNGQVMALVGDNGAGKSTLVKCVAGIHPIDGGEILWEGKPVSISGPRTRPRLGIEVVYQDLALCDNLDVVQNMYLGREILSTLRRLDESKMEQSARKVLKDLSVTTIRSVRQTVAGLSGGQRQSVAVAKAVLWNSKLVILDEPTAALGVAQTRQVLDLVKRLAQQGLAVVIVSHNMSDVFEVADYITVLRLGQNVAEFKTDRDDPARGRRGHHRRRAPLRARHAGGGAGMTSAAVQTPDNLPKADVVEPEQTVADYVRNWWAAVRGGELGAIPIVVGIIVIGIYFQSRNSQFLTAGNFVNLIAQMAPIAVIGMGMVFVLLLGEIDLSVGFVSGMGGVIAAVLLVPDGNQTSTAVAIAAALGDRVRDRAAPRLLHREDRGAVLRGDAGRPAGLERRRAADHRRQGHDRHPGQVRQRHRQRLHEPPARVGRRARVGGRLPRDTGRHGVPPKAVGPAQPAVDHHLRAHGAHRRAGDLRRGRGSTPTAGSPTSGS